MAPSHLYFHKCAHYINCSTWGSVSRARYFFASSDIVVLPTSSSSPFDDGWLPVLHPTKLQPRPLPPWLRPRATTDMGNVVQTPLAYHPKNLLYDINFFSGLSGFQQACIAYASKLYPKLPFLDFLPPFLWNEWNTLESWPADFTVELTPAILKIVSRLQDFYSNPHITSLFVFPHFPKKRKILNCLNCFSPLLRKLLRLSLPYTTLLATSLSQALWLLLWVAPWASEVMFLVIFPRTFGPLPLPLGQKPIFKLCVLGLSMTLLIIPTCNHTSH